MHVIHKKSFYYHILFIILGLFLCGTLIFYTICEKSSYKIEVISIKSVDFFDIEEECYVYFGRPSCPECIKFQRYINVSDSRLPKEIYYFNTEYWKKDGITESICDRFAIDSIPALMKIKNGDCIKRIDISIFLQ